MTTAYPLHWPDGWPRTPWQRMMDGRSRFARSGVGGMAGRQFWTFAAARDALLVELDRLGAINVVISSNFKLGRDGPSDRGRRPDDQGIAVYFTFLGEQVVMARDAFQRAEENMRSLTLAVDAMRQLDRHGGDLMMKRAFAGFAALAPPKSCWDVLGVPPGSSEVEVERAFREKAKKAHPDVGGSDAAMAELSAAREQALRQAA